MVNASKTGLVGYSIGGYGSINAAGAGFTEEVVNTPQAVSGDHLKTRQAGTKEFKQSQDDRIKAIF